MADPSAGDRIRDAVLDLLIPTCCLSCRRWLPVGALGLCRACRSRLVTTPRTRCRTCPRDLPARAARRTVRRVNRPADEPNDVESPQCGECIARPPRFAELHTLYAYQPPLDSLVKAMKFGRRAYLAELFADEIWDRWAERLSNVQLVVPVPLPFLRHRMRGYNQAEVLAQRLAKRLRRPLGQPLRRRGGSPQSRETDVAGRRRNARQTIALRAPRRPFAGRLKTARLPDRVLLVDDVVTSGATLQRCSQLLRRAGARRVICAAVAHRP